MQLDVFEKNEHIPDSLIQFNSQSGFQTIRYDSSQKWIDENLKNFVKTIVIEEMKLITKVTQKPK